MKRLLPLLLLTLSACNLLPSLLGQNGGAQPDQVPAGPAAPVGTATATPAAAAQTTTTTATATTPAPVQNGAIQTRTLDTSRRLEYVDVYTDLGDPAGQRALVPYLMKPEEWMLIKCEMLSPTAKHYKFQRVTTADGRALPQVNTFNQSR